MTDMQTPKKPFRKPWLPMRLRKLIGLVAMLALIIFYALLVMTVAVTTSVPDNKAIEFTYYLITGIAWVLPAGAIIYWMQRPDEEE
jgi:peptidoglycan/LPS O-acetylase OafA/YrhL